MPKMKNQSPNENKKGGREILNDFLWGVQRSGLVLILLMMIEKERLTKTGLGFWLVLLLKGLYFCLYQFRQ